MDGASTQLAIDPSTVVVAPRNPDIELAGLRVDPDVQANGSAEVTLAGPIALVR